jgi:hypothetical protein
MQEPTIVILTPSKMIKDLVAQRVASYKHSHVQYVAWYIAAHRKCAEFGELRKQLAAIRGDILIDVHQWQTVKDCSTSSTRLEQNVAEFSSVAGRFDKLLDETYSYLENAESHLAQLIELRHIVNTMLRKYSTVECVNGHVYAVNMFVYEHRHLTNIMKVVSNINLSDCHDLVTGLRGLLSGASVPFKSLTRRPALFDTRPLKLLVTKRQIIDWSFKTEDIRRGEGVPPSIYPPKSIKPSASCQSPPGAANVAPNARGFAFEEPQPLGDNVNHPRA